jgi:hypothetical protein
MNDKQRRARRQFTPEFKRDAVELVRTSGRPTAQIANELGIYDSTLGNWVRQDRTDRGEREAFPATSASGCASWSARTPGCGWSVTCSNEPSPSGSRRRRHRDALPLCRCPGGRWLSGSGRLPGGRVTRSAYYAWTAQRGQGPPQRRREEARLVGRSAASTPARVAPTVPHG